jgi:TolB-like protein/DNA-binding winged helix-turn-helix (wHTH) protein/Tfp pilus assembly protein PilF
MQGNQPQTIYFNGFTLDFSRGCVRRGDEEIRLRPKSFDVFQYLVRNQSRLIGKEELIQAVWPNAFVTDNSLVQCMIEIRRALGDQQTMLRTIPRRGYIFDVPASASAQPENSPAPADENERDSPLLTAAEPPDRTPPMRNKTRNKRTYFLVGVSIVLALLGLAIAVGGANIRARVFGTGSSPGIRSIAVLPLEGLSNETELDYFADGMTDALITDLAQIEALRVISRTTAMQYKKPRKPLPQIAQELHVDAVIEGTAVRSGSRVRISTQMILAREDKHIWAQSYEGDLRDVLGLQDKVAQDIVEQIKVRITPREKALLSSAPAINPEAYDAYLKSRQFLTRRTEDGGKMSVEYAKRALALQPGSALLHAGLADSLVTLNMVGYGHANEIIPEARVEAMEALQIDDSLSLAHYALAMVHFNYDWDFPAAEREFRLALQLEPNSAETRTFHGFYLSAMGSHDEAVTEMRRALQLDPLSVLDNRNLGSALYYARRYDEAVNQFQHTAAVDPNYPVVYNWLSWICQAKGLDAQAVEWEIRFLAVNGAEPAKVAALQSLVVSAGPRAYWQQQLDNRKSAGLSQTSGALAYMLAATEMRVQNKDAALQYLQRALDERSFWVPFLKVDPRLDGLHGDPRFTDLLHRVGLQK